MIEAYLQSLLDLVAASPIVRASDVTLDKRAPRVGLIRGNLYFVDGSRLHFRELVEARDEVVRRITATTTRMPMRIWSFATTTPPIILT